MDKKEPGQRAGKVSELPSVLTVWIEHIAQIERRLRLLHIALAILFGMQLAIIWMIA